MIRKLVVTAALLGTMLATSATSAFAAAPNGGSSFGSAVAGMSPDCAKMMGAAFGDCVTAMAQGLPCPHSMGN